MNQKVTGRASSIPAGLAIGGAISLVITIVGAMIGAWLMGYEKLQEQQIGYCAMIILLGSAFIGAWTAAGKIKHRRLFVCFSSGAVYFCTLLAVTALFFGGQYQAVGVTALVVLAGSISAAFMGENSKRGGQRPGTKRKHR